MTEWVRLSEHGGWSYTYTIQGVKGDDLTLNDGQAVLVRWPDGHVETLRLKMEYTVIHDPSFGKFTQGRCLVAAEVHGAPLLMPVTAFEFSKDSIPQ